MEKLKSSITNMVLVLTGVAVVTGAILAYINHVTEEPIKVQKEKTLADGIKSVMGGGDLKVSKTDTVRQNDAKGKELTYIIYQTQDANNKDLGDLILKETSLDIHYLSMLRHQVLELRLINGSKKERRVTSSERTQRKNLL